MDVSCEYAGNVEEPLARPLDVSGSVSRSDRGWVRKIVPPTVS